jgi:hypothetical protein
MAIQRRGLELLVGRSAGIAIDFFMPKIDRIIPIYSARSMLGGSRFATVAPRISTNPSENFHELPVSSNFSESSHVTILPMPIYLKAPMVNFLNQPGIFVVRIYSRTDD